MITNVIVTAYCACRLCCGPDACGITASGLRPVEGTTIACNWLPMGSVVKIQGFNVPKIVQDRMAKRFSDRMDIYFRSHQKAKQFGIRKLQVQIISKPQTK